MEHTINVKHEALTVFAACGTAVSNAMGGWDDSLTTLVIFMAADYVAGLVVAGVFRASAKSRGGGLDSRICFEGIVKKAACLLLVLIGARLDAMAGDGTTVRTMVVLFLLGNEGLSILENLGLMGVPYPQRLKNALDMLKSKGDE